LPAARIFSISSGVLIEMVILFLSMTAGKADSLTVTDKIRYL
jgi:hypothetical protein